MKKMLRLRNSIIALLCFTVICMAIGFSILSMKIAKDEENVPYFDVVFQKVTEQTSVKGKSISPKCSSNIVNNDKEVNMKCRLNAYHDELSYSVVIKNNGNMDALIVDLKENPDYLNDTYYKSVLYPATISHNDIKGKVLKPGEEITLKIYIKYQSLENVEAKSKEFAYNFSLITSSPSR